MSDTDINSDLEDKYKSWSATYSGLNNLFISERFARGQVILDSYEELSGLLSTYFEGANLGQFCRIKLTLRNDGSAIVKKLPHENHIPEEGYLNAYPCKIFMAGIALLAKNLETEYCVRADGFIWNASNTPIMEMFESMSSLDDI